MIADAIALFAIIVSVWMVAEALRAIGNLLGLAWAFAADVVAELAHAQ